MSLIDYAHKGTSKYDREAQSVEGVSHIALGVLKVSEPILYREILYSGKPCLYSKVIRIVGVWQTVIFTVKYFCDLEEESGLFLAGAEKITGNISFLFIHRRVSRKVVIDLPVAQEHRIHDLVRITMEGITADLYSLILSHTDIIEFLHEVLRPHPVSLRSFISFAKGACHSDLFLVVVCKVKEEELSGIPAADIVMPYYVRADYKGIDAFVKNLIVN